jgi:hypothetical protein
MPRKVRVFQLAAAVDAYEIRMSRLTANWFDSHACVEAESAVREVRALGIELPEFSVAALELCIAHAEVLALLWNHDAGTGGPPEPSAVERALVHRRATSAALKDACLQALRTIDA